MRESEKEGITFMRSPLPERPKRITKQRLELISRIKKQTVQEYPSFTTVNPEADITKLVKKHKKLELSSPRKHGTKGNDYILLGRKGRKKGTKNKNPMSEERKEKLKEQLAEARKKPRKKKPSTEKQIEARRKNLEKARKVKQEKIELEKAKQSTVEPVGEPNIFVDEETGEITYNKPQEKEQPKDIGTLPVEPETPETPAPNFYPKEDEMIVYNLIQILESSVYDWWKLGNVIINYAKELIEEYGEHEIVERIKSVDADILTKVLNLTSLTFYDYEKAQSNAVSILEALSGLFDGMSYVPSDIMNEVISIINEDRKIYSSSYKGWDYE